jgi:hypothetical protein
VYLTIEFSPFQIVYGFNPLTPIDLIPSPFKEIIILDREKKAKIVRQLHETVNRLFSNPVIGFGCICIRNVPNQRKSKLQPRGDGPFQVLERINDNTYKIDISCEYGVSDTFNVADLSGILSRREGIM